MWIDRWMQPSETGKKQIESIPTVGTYIGSTTTATAENATELQWMAFLALMISSHLD